MKIGIIYKMIKGGFSMTNLETYFKNSQDIGPYIEQMQDNKTISFQFMIPLSYLKMMKDYRN